VSFNHSIKEIGFLIGRAYWGNGYAKEASKALLDYGFIKMNLKEIVAKVRPENVASKKVIENMGMKYQYTIEGLPEEFDWSNGELLYSLTKSEYLHVNTFDYSRGKNDY
jgi:[ribosomal protein S5]-alanine N-acetyltransferase